MLAAVSQSRSASDGPRGSMGWSSSSTTFFLARGMTNTNLSSRVWRRAPQSQKGGHLADGSGRLRQGEAEVVPQGGQQAEDDGVAVGARRVVAGRVEAYQRVAAGDAVGVG